MQLTYPFKPWLPHKDLVRKMAVRSSGYSNNEEIIDILHTNSYSYLHAVKPHLFFRSEKKIPSEHFTYARSFIDQLKIKNAIQQLNKECYLLYRQTSIGTGDYYLGIIGLCAAEAYINGNVKIHEHTLTPKENLLIEHLDMTRMAGEPVLIMHDALHDLEHVKREVSYEKPLIQFSKEGKRHEVWIITGERSELVQKHLNSAKDLFIADGHHRSSATTRFIQEKDTQSPGFLSLFIDKADLHIDPFHRLIRADTSQLKEFLQKNHFTVRQVNSWHELELQKNQFGLYVNKEWHELTYTQKNNMLDVKIAEKFFVNEFAGIKDSKNDERIAYVEGNKPIYLSEDRVDNGDFDILITLHPCQIEDICEVAMKGETMPPKSTFVLPKLLTGLTLQALD